jgi:hypothetical protein
METLNNLLKSLIKPASGRQPHHERSQPLRCRTLRALGFLNVVILGFRSAPPQALCFRPLREFWKDKPRINLFKAFFLNSEM